MDDENERAVTPRQGGVLAGALLLGLGLIYASTKLPERGFWQVLSEAVGTAFFLAVLLDWALRGLVAAARRRDTALVDRLRSVRNEFETTVKGYRDKLEAAVKGYQAIGAQLNMHALQNTINGIDTNVKTILPRVENFASQLARLEKK